MGISNTAARTSRETKDLHYSCTRAVEWYEVRASFFDTDEATKKPALGKAPYVFGDDSS